MTTREKIAAAVAYLRSLGVPGLIAAPPLYRFLWRVGILIPPPRFQSFLGVAAVLGPVFGTGAALLSLWYDFGIEPGVAASIAFVCGLLYACLGALLHRREARRLKLPQWRDFDPDCAAKGAANPGS